MNDNDPQPAGAHLADETQARLDIETLRLIYEDTQRQLELMRGNDRSLRTEFATLSTAGAAVLALFVSAKPPSAPALIGWLYGCAVPVYLLLFYMTFKGIEGLEAAGIRLRIAGKVEVKYGLEETDFMTEKAWLTDVIVRFRVVTQMSPKYYAPYIDHLRRARLVFTALVAYLALVTMGAFISG